MEIPGKRAVAESDGVNVQRQTHQPQQRDARAATNEHTQGENTPAVAVQVSQTGRILGNVSENELRPDVRKDKVERFTQLIASGSYSPDLNEVAEAFSKSVLEDSLAVKES